MTGQEPVTEHDAMEPREAPRALTGRNLVVVSGPSGAGKTTVCHTVAERLGVPISTSATTRPRRPNEVDGRDYHFIGEEEFRRRIDQGRFVEWAEVFGQLYGTPIEELARADEAGNVLLLEIDVQGGIQIKKRFPDALAVLLLAPGLEALRRRLSLRGTEGREEAERRFAKAQKEIEMARRAGCYDVEVVNDRLADAVEKVIELVKTRRNQA
ncbi:MAG TPA: guanylate kinase [Phycisphaerae bacterium]|nr:guanylate kinase [Phycisphaerae bacterium]